MNCKRFGIFFVTICSMFVFISCSQKSPHSIPTGGIEALIPFPKSVSLMGGLEERKTFFSGEDLRIKGLENLGLSFYGTRIDF